MLIKHYKNYPNMRISDAFKYIFQSSFGCEHLVSDEKGALDYIKREYENVSKFAAPNIEPLDGEYSRVHLAYMRGGLSPETFARIFTLSAKKEEGGKAALEQKLEAARELILEGALPLDINEFEKAVEDWRASGYPAVRHSELFREKYKPAYRVIADRYVRLLPLLEKIDTMLDSGNTVIAIEGGSASGKTTIAAMLSEIYECNVFHTDDFFLRPEQRTPERLAEIGGNLDRERFYDEIVLAIKDGAPVAYRPFDCRTQTLSDIITVEPRKLTVVEGVYSTHPAFGKYFDLSVFLDIDAEYQRERILKRNSPAFAERFFNEWIPLENAYFDGTNVKERSDLVIKIDA